MRGFAILAEAGLSFLGLGTQPPTPSWGLMIQASRDYLDIAPWTALVPGVAIAITVLGLNMLGDVLRDVLDPTMAAARTHRRVAAEFERAGSMKEGWASPCDY